MSNLYPVRITCPSTEAFALQAELFDRLGDVIVGGLETTVTGARSTIAFDTVDPAAIRANTRVTITPEVHIAVWEPYE